MYVCMYVCINVFIYKKYMYSPSLSSEMAWEQ